MQQTFTTKAIILKTVPFRERDSRVLVYSTDQGLLSLVARGTQDMKSKLAPFIQPISQIEMMVAKGKAFDYLSAVVERNSFLGVKSDYEKIYLAGRAIKLFLQHIKEGEEDSGLHNLLFYFLDFLDKNNMPTEDEDLVYSFFILKFMTILGFSPELYYCVKSAKKIQKGQHFFDYKEGGLTQNQSPTSLTISEESIKIMRLINKRFFSSFENKSK